MCAFFCKIALQQFPLSVAFSNIHQYHDFYPEYYIIFKASHYRVSCLHPGYRLIHSMSQVLSSSGAVRNSEIWGGSRGSSSSRKPQNRDMAASKISGVSICPPQKKKIKCGAVHNGDWFRLIKQNHQNLPHFVWEFLARQLGLCAIGT